MKFEAKTYKRLGAMIGSIIGISTMMIAICMEKNLLGAGFLIFFTGIGVIVGSIAEKIREDK